MTVVDEISWSSSQTKSTTLDESAIYMYNAIATVQFGLFFEKFIDNSVFKARKTFYLKPLSVDFRIQVHSKHTTVIFKFASLNIH